MLVPRGASSVEICPVFHTVERVRVMKVAVSLPKTQPVKITLKAMGSGVIPSFVEEHVDNFFMHRNNILKVRWDVYGLDDAFRRSIPNCHCGRICTNVLAPERDSDVAQFYNYLDLAGSPPEVTINIDPKQEMDIIFAKTGKGWMDPEVSTLTMRPSDVQHVYYEIKAYDNLIYDANLSMG